MRLAQELVNLPVFSSDEGRRLGKIKDLYLDEQLEHVTAVYLGSQGLLNRAESFIREADITTLGQDMILVQSADCVMEEARTAELREWIKRWIRREELRGREICTPEGTKIGRIGDIVLDEEANIVGFSLSQVFVNGLLTDNNVVSRSAIIERDDGNAEGPLLIRLAEAEEQGSLRVATVTATGNSEASDRP